MRRTVFTLIELLVVIAIIAILAAILFPVFAQAKQAAKQAKRLSNSKQTPLAIDVYPANYDDVVPPKYTHIHQPYIKNYGLVQMPRPGPGTTPTKSTGWGLASSLALFGSIPWKSVAKGLTSPLVTKLADTSIAESAGAGAGGLLLGIASALTFRRKKVWRSIRVFDQYGNPVQNAWIRVVPTHCDAAICDGAARILLMRDTVNTARVFRGKEQCIACTLINGATEFELHIDANADDINVVVHIETVGKDQAA